MLGLLSYSAILALLALGTLRRPAVGLAAIICLYGLKQWGQSATGFFALHREVANYAVGSIVLAGVALNASRRVCVLCINSAATKLIGLLYLYALMSVTWSPDSLLSLAQWRLQGPYIITTVLLAPLLLFDIDDVRVAFDWTLLAGGALCLFALMLGHWGPRGLLLQGTIDDAQTNPLALAALAATVMVIAALSLRDRRSLWRRLLALSCIPVGLAVVLRSGSRGELIAAIAAVVITWPFAFRVRNLRSLAALALAATVVAGLAWWGSTLVHIDASRWSGAQPQDAAAGRFDNAIILLHAAAATPATLVFGLGNSSAYNILGIYPHITVLEVLAEEGVIGFAIYLTILAVAIRNFIRLLTDAPDRYSDTLATLGGLFLYTVIVSWKEGSLLSNVYVFTYAIALGRLESRSRAATALAPGPISAPARPLPFANLMD